MSVRLVQLHWWGSVGLLACMLCPRELALPGISVVCVYSN